MITFNGKKIENPVLRTITAIYLIPLILLVIVLLPFVIVLVLTAIVYLVPLAVLFYIDQKGKNV